MEKCCRNKCKCGQKVISREIVKEVYLERQIILMRGPEEASPKAAGKSRSSCYRPTMTSPKVTKLPSQNHLMVSTNSTTKISPKNHSTTVRRSFGKSPRRSDSTLKPWLSPASFQYSAPNFKASRSKSTSNMMSLLTSGESTKNPDSFFGKSSRNNSLSSTVTSSKVNHSEYGDLPKWDLSRISQKKC